MFFCHFWIQHRRAKRTIISSFFLFFIGDILEKEGYFSVNECIAILDRQEQLAKTHKAERSQVRRTSQQAFTYDNSADSDIAQV